VARPVLMPKMGFAMQEGKILRWLKREGDRVERGEPIAEIETEKVNIEIEAFDSGTLLKIVAPEGATVPVGQVIAVLGEPGESVEEALRAAGAEAAATQREAIGAGEGAEATPVQAAAGAGVARVEPESHPELHAPAAVEQPAAPPPEVEERLKVSPLARRLAQELGINLAEVKGTGPGGRITREDVEAYAAQRRAAAAAPPAAAAAAPPRPAPAPAVPGPVPAQEQLLSRMRQTIARRMSESKGPVPHFYLTSEIEMTEALRARQAANALLDDAQKLSINDLVLKAVALALRKFPNLNAAYAGDRVQLFSEINIGIAVALEGGLVVPVIRNCDQKSLPQIAQEAKDLASRARSGHLRPEELEGGTFTVSNLGMYDVESFIAIINPPQAGILAVGSVLRRPAVKDDQIVITDLMKVTLSADHRVTDGAEGARFLQEVKRLLQNPMSLFL
jgi:pyruvate dehydrogenase E2 component (dihydrolipoamide acetyltransferase)